MKDAIDHGLPAEMGARAAFSRQQRWVLLTVFAIIVCCRIPLAWKHGRFFGEEATVFLAYAWHRPWLDALFRPFAGYLNLGANATTLIVARLVQGGVVPLERAPYCTMIMALAAQLLPAGLVLTGNARWLANRSAVMAALLAIAIMPYTEEVFFNVLHIQFHLALCVALILAFDVPQRWSTRVRDALLLFLAPLCGPAAIMLLPVFIARAFVDHDRRRIEQIAPLASGAAIQMLLFYGTSPLRGHILDPGTIVAILFVRLIVMPIFGDIAANTVGTALYKSQMAGSMVWWGTDAIALLLFGTLLFIALRRRDAALWLLLCSLGIGTASFGGGMVVIGRSQLFFTDAGERYDFLPLVLLALALIVLARRPQLYGARIFSALCGTMLIIGAANYNYPIYQISQGPSWPKEVALWRRDHRHPLAVWPAPWTADLSDTSRSCSPPPQDPVRSTDPSYCESGWATAISRMQQSKSSAR